MKRIIFFKRINGPAANRIFPFVVTVITIGLLTGCEKDKNDGNATNKELRNAYETIVEANAVKQAAMYDAIKALSDDHSRILFSHELTYEQVDAVFAAFAGAAEYSDDVDKALKVIEATKKKSTLYKNDSRLKSTLGIGSAMRDFYEWCSGAGKRSRDRIITVASNLPANERTQLYNSLRSDWKSKTSSESDFWDKLDKGEFNNQASQMYNDFYNNTETNFFDLAQDKGLTTSKIVTREGAEGIKAGAKVVIETTKLATPLGKGMDMVEKVDDLVENVKLIVTDPKGAVVEEIKSQVASRLGEFVDVDGLLDEAELGEETGIAIKTLLDAALGSDDPEEWIKDAIDWGATKIIDADSTGSKADIVIAENKNEGTDGEPEIIIGIKPTSTDANEGIDLVLPEGEWEIDVIDVDGIQDQMITFITENLLSVLLASTDQAHQQQNSSYSLSAWVSPGNPAPGESVTVYALISPKEPDVDIYFDIVGTDGYAKSSTVPTDSEGQCNFYIPGGAEGVSDVITVRIVKTGLTRTLSYVF